jgi:hypothetical protein
MAYETGTATNHADLLAKLRDFLTTDASLVADSQQWDVIGGVDTGTPADMDFVSFEGPGLAGDDQIFASIRIRDTPVINAYNWEMYGHTSYNPLAPGVEQSGNPLAPVTMLLTNNPIVYWFFANGRHFKVVTRISGRYDASYVGLILPDHTPLDWSLPFYLGGSSFLLTTASAADDTPRHTNFWHPCSISNNANVQTTAYMLTPGGVWRPTANQYYAGDLVERTMGFGMVVTPHNADTFYRNIRRALDGQPWITRTVLAQIGDGAAANSGGAVTTAAPDGGNWYGALDGVFYTPAFGAAAEEIVTIDGNDYILFPNIARTSDGMFAALAIED